MSQQTVRLGYIGAGRFSQSRLLPAFKSIPGVELTAVSNSTPESSQRVAQEFGFHRVYDTWQELVGASDIDAVVIGTPPFEHPRMLRAAVEAGKHVYCEKPMGVDVAGCLSVIKTGRMADPKINISVGFQQRYGPVYLEAYKRIQSGAIGEMVKLIEVARLYEAYQKMIQSFDSIDDRAINDLGRVEEIQ